MALKKPIYLVQLAPSKQGEPSEVRYCTEAIEISTYLAANPGTNIMVSEIKPL